MVSVIKLSSSTFAEFINLHNENFSKLTYDKNFLDCYNKQSFIPKVLMKKFLKLITFENEIIGYLWLEIPTSKYIRILSMYIKDEYIENITEQLFKNYDNNIVAYEAYHSKKDEVLLKRLGFVKVQSTILMELELNNVNQSPMGHYHYGVIELYPVDSRNDVENRCTLQNRIFDIENRIPIDVEDIENDMEQDYYIEDLSMLLNYNKLPVGYGQIIYNRNMFTIVNFGIAPSYRGRGLGEKLLYGLIEKAKLKGIEKLTLRVDPLNKEAINLYKKVGFKETNIINKWQR